MKCARFEQMVGLSTVRVIHDIGYGYVRARALDHYPAIEEFFVIAPAVVEAKTRHGFEWFEARWKDALGEREQGRLLE